VSNVLNNEKKQQIIALGKLDWSLRRIQKAVGVRRETASSYLKEAGVAVRPPGGWGRASPAKPANGVITDSGAIASKPAIEVTTGSGVELPGRSPSASACAPHRDAIEVGLSRGRNPLAIWQDLVDACGFTAGHQSVRRFVRKLESNSSPEARVVIETAAGEEAQVDYGDGPMVRDPQTGRYRRVRPYDVGLQPQVRSTADLPLKLPDLGGVA